MMSEDQRRRPPACAAPFRGDVSYPNPAQQRRSEKRSLARGGNQARTGPRIASRPQRRSPPAPSPLVWVRLVRAGIMFSWGA